MRTVVRMAVLIDGGATPKAQFKNLFEKGCSERGYSAEEYPVDSSGDTSIYYKVVKSE